MPQINRLHAFAIANAYLLGADERGFVPREVLTIDEWDTAPPIVYNHSLENDWIVLLQRAKGEIRIESSRAVCVDRDTGEVTYFGSLGDEG